MALLTPFLAAQDSCEPTGTCIVSPDSGMNIDMCLALMAERIEVYPGEHVGCWTLENDITLIGVGGRPQDIMLRGDCSSTVITIPGSSPRIQNLSISGGGILGDGGTRGGGILISAGSAAELHNVRVVDNYGERGAGLYIEDSSPDLVSVDVRRNMASYAGGGIWSQNSDLYISSSAIMDNRADDEYGGGIRLDGGQAFIWTSVVANNWADSFGGGLYASQLEFLDVFGSEFADNSGTSGGGLHLVTNGNAKIDETVIERNTARHQDGGGIYASETDVNIIGSYVLDNAACNYGGGMHASRSNVTMTTTNLSRNNTIEFCGISTSGGGLNLEDGRATLVHVTVADNFVTSDGDGGGVNVSFQAKLTAENSIFSGNHTGEPHIPDGQGDNIYEYEPGSVTLTYSALYAINQYGAPYSGATGVTGQWPDVETYEVELGTGSFVADPKFANEYYQLSEDSPCIDAGSDGTNMGHTGGI